MKHYLLKSILLGIGFSPLLAIAGGVDVIVPATPVSRVDIPDMREGWGFFVEGSVLRGYNNNLNYFVSNDSVLFISDSGEAIDNNGIFQDLSPDYAFTLRLGMDYTFAQSGNMLKLYYEHLFPRTANASTQAIVLENPFLDIGEIDIEGAGSVKQQLDGVTFLSEQHILIGPIWETTLSGGIRYARVSQELEASAVLAYLIPNNDSYVDVPSDAFTMQFNGVGPLAGFGTIFHVADQFAIGAEALGALLVGYNKIAQGGFDLTYDLAGNITGTQNNVSIDPIYSLVTEMYYRLYGNYFYRFQDGSELQIEAGWRANQFFNLRTFEIEIAPLNGGYGFDNVRNFANLGPSVNTTTSDDIGFSGPYLMVHYKL